MHSYTTRVEGGPFTRTEAATIENAAELAVFRNGVSKCTMRVHVRRDGLPYSVYEVKRVSPAQIVVTLLSVQQHVNVGGIWWSDEGEGQWIGWVEGATEATAPRVSIQSTPGGAHVITSTGAVTLMQISCLVDEEARKVQQPCTKQT